MRGYYAALVLLYFSFICSWKLLTQFPATNERKNSTIHEISNIELLD